MKVAGAWLEAPATQAVCAMLESGGHRALFVGGCVRNALLRRPVADVDIATDALPQRVLSLAAKAGHRGIETGLEHGTVTVVSSGIPHEVTTFRRDVQSFGRRAVVAFSNDVAEDAGRRDFTMNALYADPEGTVIDPLGGGLADLAVRRVRFVGDATDRIREDYLRILRFFRFFAWYGDPSEGPDAQGLAACAIQAHGLAVLSRERVTAEMRRLLLAPDPAPAVAAMEHTGVLARLLPGATGRFLPVLVHLERDAPPDWLRRLVVLGGDTDGLRLARGEARRLAVLQAALGSLAGAAELGYRHGVVHAADMVLARAAVTGTPPPGDWQAEVARGADAEFPVRAADLMPMLQGPELGRRLAALEDRWIASGFRLCRNDLLA